MEPIATRGAHRETVNSSTFAHSSQLRLGFGSLFFAAWGLVDPRGLADAMGRAGERHCGADRGG